MCPCNPDIESTNSTVSKVQAQRLNDVQCSLIGKDLTGLSSSALNSSTNFVSSPPGRSESIDIGKQRMKIERSMTWFACYFPSQYETNSLISCSYISGSNLGLVTIILM